jgi:hypothetical protein
VGRVVDLAPGSVHRRTTGIQPEPALILIASDDATTAQVIIAWQAVPQEPGWVQRCSAEIDGQLHQAGIAPAPYRAAAWADCSDQVNMAAGQNAFVSLCGEMRLAPSKGLGSAAIPSGYASPSE